MSDKVGFVFLAAQLCGGQVGGCVGEGQGTSENWNGPVTDKALRSDPACEGIGEVGGAG